MDIERKKSGGLVYSTDGGRMCPKCRRPIGQCVCAQKKPGSVPDGVIEVQGDHCAQVIETLKNQGWVVKRAGG